MNFSASEAETIKKALTFYKMCYNPIVYEYSEQCGLRESLRKKEESDESINRIIDKINEEMAV